MRVLLNVWRAFKEYFAADQSVEWTKKHHAQWELVAKILQLQAESADGD